MPPAPMSVCLSTFAAGDDHLAGVVLELALEDVERALDHRRAHVPACLRAPGTAEPGLLFTKLSFRPPRTKFGCGLPAWRLLRICL